MRIIPLPPTTTTIYTLPRDVLSQEDGLLVYSTCAFDPVQNEAVVAELLRR